MALYPDPRVAPVLSLASARGLQIENLNATPNTAMYVAMDEVILTHYLTGVARRFTGVQGSVAQNNTDDGAAIQQNLWYYVWLAANENGQLFLYLSLSATAPAITPTIPYRMRLGAVKIDNTPNKFFLRTRQRGNETRYNPLVGTSTPAVPHLHSGALGTVAVTGASFVALSVANFIPPTARAFRFTGNNNTNNGTSASLIAAPFAGSTGFGGTNPCPMLLGAGAATTMEAIWPNDNGMPVNIASGANSESRIPGWVDTVNAT